MHMKDQQQLQILKCQTKLGWYPCYWSMSCIIQSSSWQVLVIRTPEGSLCCPLLSRVFESSDELSELSSELSNLRNKSNLASTRKRSISYLVQGFGCHGH